MVLHSPAGTLHIPCAVDAPQSQVLKWLDLLHGLYTLYDQAAPWAIHALHRATRCEAVSWVIHALRRSTIARRLGASGVVDQILRNVPGLGSPEPHMWRRRDLTFNAHIGPDCPVDSAAFEKHHASTVPYS